MAGMDKDLAAATITSCAALLEQHTKIHVFSVAMTVVAGAMLLVSIGFSASVSSLWLGTAAFIVLLGLAETWFAIRVGFDRRLLSAIASGPEDLQRWDQALTELKLMPKSKTGRGLSERLHGCIRLLKMQAVLLVAQSLVAVSGMVLHLLST